MGCAGMRGPGKGLGMTLAQIATTARIAATNHVLWMANSTRPTAALAKATVVGDLPGIIGLGVGVSATLTAIGTGLWNLTPWDGPRDGWQPGDWSGTGLWTAGGAAAGVLASQAFLPPGANRWTGALSGAVLGASFAFGSTVTGRWLN